MLVTHKIITKDFYLIIQDKSSCFPPFVLIDYITNNTKLLSINSDFIDACAAPGNKTSYLAALIEMYKFKNTNIFAIEIDIYRYNNLCKNLQQRNALSYTHTMNTSFLRLDPNSSLFNNVQYLLLDPSCSGSGTYSIETVLPRTDTIKLNNLISNQIDMLKHAM